MATGNSTYDGLAMGLFGEYELAQVDSAVDCFTITGVTDGGAGTLLSIQNSDKTPAVNGLRLYDYGRTRIIRTDAASHGGTYNNALDVKYDIDYAVGAEQCYAVSFILDVSGGSTVGGRTSCLHIQMYCNLSAATYPEAYSFITLGDNGTYETPVFMHVLGSTIGSTGMLQPIAAMSATHGLVMYWSNTKYFILVNSASA